MGGGAHCWHLGLCCHLLRSDAALGLQSVALQLVWAHRWRLGLCSHPLRSNAAVGLLVLVLQLVWAHL